MKALFAVAALLIAAMPASAQPGYVAPDGRTWEQLIAAHVVPDPEKTPGAAYTDDPAFPPVALAQMCVAGWTATVRPKTSFTNPLRAEMTPEGHEPGEGELDHAWSIEDGGYPGSRANPDLSRKNLWWQAYSDHYGARVKDVLETKVHRMLCAGSLTIQEAHDALLPNWLAGYEKYVGPLPR